MMTVSWNRICGGSHRVCEGLIISQLFYKQIYKKVGKYIQYIPFLYRLMTGL